MVDQVVLPDDQEQFKLNEVCKLANVQPYMLRFWGSEFPQLEAAKSGTGQRLYTREQVELAVHARAGRADPRDPPTALRRGSDHRRRPQEDRGRGRWGSKSQGQGQGKGERRAGQEGNDPEDEQRPQEGPEEGSRQG